MIYLMLILLNSLWLKENIYKITTFIWVWDLFLFLSQLAGLSVAVLCCRPVALKRFHSLHVTTACMCCVAVRDAMLGEHYMYCFERTGQTPGLHCAMCLHCPLQDKEYLVIYDMSLWPPPPNTKFLQPALAAFKSLCLFTHGLHYTQQVICIDII